ncbi:PTS sugar transporter subunit IIA [Candidatus Enterococcus murrayae]|uniref:Ascorbate-specific PTS system EIIA component n=1 Tax=Candidatus Enterococcus murrayae TaxID=2815321 RepID=A0ABS3HFI8_9ENTE|nr:PTS sugar transporter subunit IIA [Enterococcus sp. MJM16]
MDENEKNYLCEEHLEFRSKVTDWKEAIALAAQPLLIDQIIEKKYISAMIENVLNLGDYMVLVPRVAMPHARPESGALKTGFSILKLEEPVVFGETQPVYLIICLATNDNEAHLTMLQKISSLIDEEEKVDALLKTTTKTEFIKLSERFINEEEY